MDEPMTLFPGDRASLVTGLGNSARTVGTL
jgi:hypothetical protein